MTGGLYDYFWFFRKCISRRAFFSRPEMLEKLHRWKNEEFCQQTFPSTYCFTGFKVAFLCRRSGRRTLEIVTRRAGRKEKINKIILLFAVDKTNQVCNNRSTRGRKAPETESHKRRHAMEKAVKTRAPLIHIGFNDRNRNGNRILFCFRIWKIFGVCVHGHGIRGNFFSWWWGYWQQSAQGGRGGRREARSFRLPDFLLSAGIAEMRPYFPHSGEF